MQAQHNLQQQIMAQMGGSHCGMMPMVMVPMHMMYPCACQSAQMHQSNI
jgi:hypothetical protein